MKKRRRQVLGQHFLHNPRILDKIIQNISPQETDHIIEVGAGKGALTSRLAATGARITAIEIDGRLIPELNKLQSPSLSVLHADFLKIDLAGISRDCNVKLVGNLPYSISSPILFKALGEKEHISACHFLIQKEVAERLTAGPNSKKYAPLSIIFQIYFTIQIDFYVGPGSFSPPPRVDSAKITLLKRDRPLFHLDDEQRFLKLLNTLFLQRRKKLINNLKQLALPAGQLNRILHETKTDGDLRPEQIAIEQFVLLYNKLYGDQE